MPERFVLETDRLLLRSWRETDLEPFAAINADPRVMEYFPSPLTRAESDFLADKISERIQKSGFGLWAVEERGGAPFIGFVGLAVPLFEAAFTPCVEVGWRLAYAHWGRGYAPEAAAAALDDAFGRLDLQEIVSFTTQHNQRSRRVMEKLGMTHSLADDFDHPELSCDHPLLRHVLYRLSRKSWLTASFRAASPPIRKPVV
jgi:RimJ/RimL family protein N-acetyltransferase